MATTSYGINPANSRLFPAKKKDDWEKYIGTMPSITGEQAAVSTPMSEYLADALAGVGNQPTFEEWSEQGNIPDIFGGALGGQAQSAYSEAMAGAMPDMFGGELGSEAMSAYKEALAGTPVDYNPSGANFLTNVMPAIKESYVGTGAIMGTEVGDRINLQAGVEKERIASIRASLYDQAKQRQAQAAGNYQQAYQSMGEAVNQRKLAAASSYQQQWQNQLSIAYDNYTKQNPAASEILQAALSYLNIPMMGVYQKPVTSSGGWNQ